MDIEVRQLRTGEEEAFERSVRTPFLYPITEDDADTAELKRHAAALETGRAWVATDEGSIVANACIYSMDVTLPAPPGRDCPVIPMAGVSAVGVHPTHRRRGLLRSLMSRMLSDARSRGEAIAGLIASESIIYGRFGFGLASDMVELSIATHRSEFNVRPPEQQIRLLAKEEARKALPELHERLRRTRAGEPSRSTHDWDEILLDPPSRRSGSGGAFMGACDDGYVTYRAREGDIMRGTMANLVVEELWGQTADVEAALWRFVLDLDLVGRVIAKRRPVDEPLRWRLADPRQLQVQSVFDRLYIRVLDVASALEARGFRQSGSLVFEVLPPSVDEADADPAPGRWLLEAGPDGASCRRARSGEEPQLRLAMTALGTLLLGGFPASLLARAGLAQELTAGGLQSADNLFCTVPAPLTVTGF